MISDSSTVVPNTWLYRKKYASQKFYNSIFCQKKKMYVDVFFWTSQYFTETDLVLF